MKLLSLSLCVWWKVIGGREKKTNANENAALYEKIYWSIEIFDYVFIERPSHA
jgi:hypothetical protein